jgi:S1-C subfamily serine protease
MNQRLHVFLASALVWVLAAAGAAPAAGTTATNGVEATLRGLVVKIYVTVQRHDYTMPWQSSVPANGTGSGLLIGKRRVLTNAHIASDARFLEVQRDDDPRKYRARVEHVGHDCDLATLLITEEDFPADGAPPTFAQELPSLNEEVTVVGYPTGGTRLSVTRGVVSRVDYNTYSHSGVDQHLVLQVDAAVNPGNSGGPIVYRGQIAGLAFQGMSWAENIGYAIPTPVISHFLDDIRDGVYHGYPELGVAFLGTENPALRTHLGLENEKGGIVVSYVDPFGCAHGKIVPGDVLLTIDGCPIASDGTVVLNGNTLIFNELLERKQWSESVVFTLRRGGASTKLSVPLTGPFDPFVFRNEYDKPPRYFVYGGLVFSPLTREYLKSLDRSLSGPNDQQLLYYSQYAKVDRLYEGRDEFVVLIHRLPNPVNTYADGYLHAIVGEVNGLPIRNLKDLPKGLAAVKGRHHTIRFLGMDDFLVLDAETADKANLAILERYGVPAASRLESAP